MVSFLPAASGKLNIKYYIIFLGECQTKPVRRFRENRKKKTLYHPCFYAIILEPIKKELFELTILVTGGAGFIGSNFIRWYRKKYPAARIVCYDALTYAGHLESLHDMTGDGNFRFVKGDICDKDGVASLFTEERPDAVVNFAAESHVDRSIETPDSFTRTNIIGTQVLMDACRDFGGVRFHQISTDEVYGDLPLDRPDLSFREDSPLHTSSPYSASKAGADLLALAYCRTYGLPVTISRCANNYGPYQHPEKLIPRMIGLAENRRPLPVFGTGANVRDWIFVSDHCSAVDRILCDGKPGEIYNVGANCETDNLSVVKMICRATGAPEELITFVADRKGHDLRYALNADKLRRELGWQPETGFDEGLRQTIQWYRDNMWWWDKLNTEPNK